MPETIESLPTSAVAIENQSAEAYDAARDAVRSSALKQILITPAHYRHYLTHPKPATAAMTLGSALHAALLEPTEFQRRYAVVPKIDRRTKSGRAQWDAWSAEHADKTLIPATDGDLIDRLRAAVEQHGRARRLLTLPGKAEVSLFWTDAQTGLRLKARPDRLLEDPRRILLEVKSTTRADPCHFQRRIVDFDYPLSLAMYRDGVRAVYGELPPAVFLVIEDETCQVCLYKPDVEMLSVGHHRYRTALERLARCLETNQWPGYQPEGRIEEIALPRWAQR